MLCIGWSCDGLVFVGIADFEMADGSQGTGHLKSSGGVGKKLKKKLKIGKSKGRGRGKIRRKHI